MIALTQLVLGNNFFITNSKTANDFAAAEGNGEPDFNDLPTDNETAITANFSFYPNPANKQLFVDLPQNNEAKMYEIFNTTGELVSSGSLSSLVGLNTLDIKHLVDGLYLLRINGYKGQTFIVKQ